MRVLAGLGYFGKYGETDGVITTYSHLIPFFQSRGIEIDLICNAPYDDIQTPAPGVRLICHKPRIPLPLDEERVMDPAIMASRTARYVLTQHYDIVQSSSPDPTGLLAMAYARKMKVPFLVLYHTALDKYAAIRVTNRWGESAGRVAGALMNRWVSWYYRSADYLLAPSQYSQVEIQALVDSPVGILSRGVDPERFNPARRRRGPHDKLRVLYVGRVTPEKNLQLLIDWYRDRHDIDLWVVGEGPFKQTIQAALPQATVTGTLTGEALAEAYASADLFAFPSRTDTLGNVVLEAMASGVPTVVTDSMGPKELVQHGVTGLVATSDREFCESLDRLLTHPARLRQMGMAAREAALKRSWRSVFDTLVSYYHHLTTSRSQFATHLAESVGR